MKKRTRTVAMFNLNEIRRDPRARRIAGTLRNMGYRVVAFGPRTEIGKELEWLDGFEVVRVAFKGSCTDADMARFQSLSEEVAAAIHASNRQVMSGIRTSGFGYAGRRLWRRLYRQGRSAAHHAGLSSEHYRFDDVEEVLAIRRIMIANLEFYEAAARYAPDAIYCNDLDTLVCGCLFRARYGIPVIFDAHELYPEQHPRHMRSDIWHHFYSTLQTTLVPHADGRITVCDSIARYLERSIPAGAFLVVRNCLSLRMLAPEAVLDRPRPIRTITYHGAYFRYRGLEEVIQAAKAVENAHFLFRGIGGHEQHLKRLVARTGVADRVSFAPPVPVESLVKVASECDIGLSPFRSVCLNSEFALPNKFFEYMSAGLALASADLIEMRLLTHRHGVGVLYDPSDVAALSQSLNEMISDADGLDQMRKNAYYAARDELHWEREEIKLRDYVAAVVG